MFFCKFCLLLNLIHASGFNIIEVFSKFKIFKLTGSSLICKPKNFALKILFFSVDEHFVIIF